MSARAALAAAAVLAGLWPAAAAPGQTGEHHDAGGPVTEVEIGFSAFDPPHLDVLVGDTVRWRNVSVRAHTVTARDGSFDSGRMPPGGTFTRHLDRPGAVPYFCRLHPIPGSLDAHVLLLGAPGPAGPPGRPRALRGRAALPPGTDVRLEADDGTGFAPVATLPVAADGTVGPATVAPRRATTYRLAAGDAVSPPRALGVLDRRVDVGVRPLAGRRTRVRAHVVPGSPGLPVVLQLLLPERFGWWPVARARLDAGSRARFVLPRGRRMPARVAVTLADGATILAVSRVVTVGDRPPARRRDRSRD